MTIDRDDPEGRSRSPQSESVEAVCPSAEDRALCREVRGMFQDMLLDEGLSPKIVLAIFEDAEREFRMFRQTIQHPAEFLVKRISGKRDKYRNRRGTESEADPEERPPHLLDLVRTRAVLDTLSPHARTALLVMYSREGTFQDVADELDVSLEYAKRLVRKTLDTLEERIVKRGPEE